MKFLQRILVVALVSAIAHAAAPKLEAIDQVWSGHSVNFAIQTSSARVFVAYYDANRRLTVASRARDGGTWTYQKLDSVTGWDSHNYLALAEDRMGQLHLIGNMHNDPLNYFRTNVAGDVGTFARVSVLVDPRVEQRMTYPVFLTDREGRLVLKYRDGGSGNGNEIYAVYSAAIATWSHLLDTPLIDGEGKRNAYVVGPTVGPAHDFHLAWVWRDTPDAETNHDLSYARSRDLVHWEKSDGTPLELPITLEKAEVVDRVPVGGGMINNNTVVGFGNDGRPIITYHKFDARGNTQIYLARREKKRWRIVQISNWNDFRWDFRGRGSLESRLTVSGAVPASNGNISVDLVRDGKPITFLIKSRTLELVSERPAITLAGELRKYLEVPEGMQLNAIAHSNSAIAWPTLPPNRDRPRESVPAPTTLWLATFEEDYGIAAQRRVERPSRAGVPMKYPIRRATLVVAVLSLTMTPLTGADVVRPSRKDVLTIAARVADWQLARLDAAHITHFKEESRSPLSWEQGAFWVGMTRLADASGEKRFREAILNQGRANQWKPGPRLYHADDHVIGQSYLWAARHGAGAEAIAPLRATFDAILAKPAITHLSFYIPKNYEDTACLRRWCWCDALFMSPPAWVELTQQTGDTRYTEFALAEFWATADFLYDPVEQLFFRDSRFFERRDDKGRKLFWSRGNGWVFAGIANLLESLPKDHPQRARMEKLFRMMAGKLKTIQKPDGYWAPSLLGAENSPPETSGTGFYVYGLAWGLKNGLLDAREYRPAIDNGWAALMRAVAKDGKLGWVQQVSDRPENVAEADTQFYGVGAFLLAASAVASIAEG